MSETETEHIPETKRRLHPAAIAAAGVAGVLLILFAVWFFAIRGDSEAGKPVAAPRTTSMDDMSDGESVAGQTITVSAEQLAASGIKIESIGEQLASEVGLTAATGVVEPNAYRNIPIISLVGGAVRSINAELGQNVNKGQTVAVVFSSEFAEAQSQYVRLLTETENARKGFERSKKLVDLNHVGAAEVFAAERKMKAAEAALTEMQKRFQRTNRLIAIGAASREELEQDTTKLRTAEAEVTEARNMYDHAVQFLEINPEARSQNEEALNKLRTAEGELAAVRQRLILFGMPDGRIASLRSASQVTSEMPIAAPISGTITSRTVNIGEVVEANKELFKITDLSGVWVIAQVFERDLARLRIGSGASVTSTAFGDRLFRGHVTYIDPAIDQTTRTAKVRIEIADPDKLLKLGMYVNVAFGSLGQSERTVPVVPTSAVQNIGGKQILFASTGDPNVFELRPLRLGTEIDGKFPVIEGAKVGDRIVTTGSFMLRAEWLKTHQGMSPQ